MSACNCLKRMGECEGETSLALLVWCPKDRCDGSDGGARVRVARGLSLRHSVRLLFAP